MCFLLIIPFHFILYFAKSAEYRAAMCCQFHQQYFTCGIMDIGFRNGVDESSVKGVVDEGGVGVGDVGGGIGQSIPSIFYHGQSFNERNMELGICIC